MVSLVAAKTVMPLAKIKDITNSNAAIFFVIFFKFMLSFVLVIIPFDYIITNACLQSSFEMVFIYIIAIALSI